MVQPHRSVVDGHNSRYDSYPLQTRSALPRPRLHPYNYMPTAEQLPRARTAAFDGSALSTGKLECSMCLEDVSPGEEVMSQPCSHWFHSHCLEAWLKAHYTCPVCRRGISRNDLTRHTVSTLAEAPLSEEDSVNIDRLQSDTLDAHEEAVTENAVDFPSAMYGELRAGTGATLEECSDPAVTWNDVPEVGHHNASVMPITGPIEAEAETQNIICHRATSPTMDRDTQVPIAQQSLNMLEAQMEDTHGQARRRMYRYLGITLFFFSVVVFAVVMLFINLTS